MVSKYFQSVEHGFLEQDMATAGKGIMSTPLKKRRVRVPRSFGIYTYRGNKFLFNYEGEHATVSLLDSRTNRAISSVKVLKDRAYRAARALVRILEAEAILRELEAK